MKLMSNMDTVPLFGTNFSVYAPLITVILCIATLFNWYARLLSMLGVDHDDAIVLGGGGGDAVQSDERDLKIREGMALLNLSDRATDRGSNHVRESVLGVRRGKAANHYTREKGEIGGDHDDLNLHEVAPPVISSSRSFGGGNVYSKV